MKKIGFLSFGHWANRQGYNARTARDTLLQSIDLAVAGALREQQSLFRNVEGRNFAPVADFLN